MSVNARPTKKLVPPDDAAKKDVEVELSENASQLLGMIEKMDSSEKLFTIEDRIATEMTHDGIHHQFTEDYMFLKKAIEEYLEGKFQPTKTDTIARIARLRRNTRLCHYATAQMRKVVSERMELVDAKLLQMQNVTSEVQHIQKEIDRCLDFSAGDEELELIPVEQFYAEAPESVSKSEETIGNEHEQYLARLTFENDQRRELLSNLHELEGRRNVLQSDIRGKELRLQKLKPKLEDLAKTAEPVFEIVGTKFKDLTLDGEQKKLSLTLPAPLAVAYTHATAYKEIHDDKNFEFRIVGSNENVKLTKDDAESKKIRKEDETTHQKIEDSTANILDVHPMSIEFDIACGNDDLKITMIMQYLTELKVTTAKWQVQTHSKNKQSLVLSPDTLMTDVFEGDSGESCPDSVGALKLDHLNINFDSTSKQIGKPYRFVQKLSGGGGAEGIAVTEHLRKVVKAVRERISNREVLDVLIGSLESRKKEGLDIEANVKINSFEHCEDEMFISSIPPSLSQLISKSGVSDRFPYKVELVDDHSNKLCAFLSIPADYPRHTVLFGIKTTEDANTDNVKEVEDLLNNEANYVDDVNGLKEQLSLLSKHISLS